MMNKMSANLAGSLAPDPKYRIGIVLYKTFCSEETMLGSSPMCQIGASAEFRLDT